MHLWLTGDTPREMQRLRDFVNKCTAVDDPAEKLLVLKESEELDAMFTALQVACGARMMEIVKTSRFEPSGAHSITQRGISKKRDKSRAVVIAKPLFCLTSDEFFALLKKVRASVAKLGSTSLESRLNRSFSAFARDTWGVQFSQIGTHLNRAIYANSMAYLLQGENKSYPLLIKELLGHESMSTTPHYMGVRAVD